MRTYLALAMSMSLMLADPVWAACVQTARSVSLQTLAIESCLWAPKASRAEHEVVTELRVQFQNKADQAIVLELPTEPLLAHILVAYLGPEAKTKSELPGAGVQESGARDVLQSHRLAPGETRTEVVPISVFFDRKPKRNSLYRVYLNHGYFWRREAEPAGQAVSLRIMDANRTREFPKDFWFDEVRFR
ncbi:MAG: hypothetical protein JNN30_19100 [Rhodanobacteraceae bacterium]|nr:hypothetical protein [Rhodanobacteraceae bacterium]